MIETDPIRDLKRLVIAFGMFMELKVMSTLGPSSGTQQPVALWDRRQQHVLQRARGMSLMPLMSLPCRSSGRQLQSEAACIAL